MPNRITLYIDNDSWIAEFTGPASISLVDVLGTNRVPTAFTSQAPSNVVVSAIAKRNPEFDVIVK